MGDERIERAAEALATVSADAAARRVVSWLATISPARSGARGGETAAPEMLERWRNDSDGFAFTRRLIEALVNDGDPFASALGLRDAARDLPRSMPAAERLAMRAGGIASIGLPWAVLPMARKWLRGSVSHLVLTAKIPRDAALQLGGGPNRPHASPGDAFSGAGHPGGTVLALSGAPVLGEAGARRELERLKTLAAQPEVTRIAVSVARLVPQSPAGAWALDREANLGARLLRELLEAARPHDTAILLEPHDYRTALLAPQLLVQALEHPGLEQVRAGVTLAAELPESVRAAEGLILASRARLEAGGHPLEVVVGVLGLAAGEQISSILSGLPVPTLGTAVEQHAALLRVAGTLIAQNDAVRTVVASEDPHLLAAVTLLAERLGAQGSPTIQLRAGITPDLGAAIAEHGFEIRQRLPLTTPGEFEGAVDSLIALAAETADHDSVLARARAILAGERAALDEGAARIEQVLEIARDPAPESHRVQRRDLEWQGETRGTALFYRPPGETAQFDTGGLTAAVLNLTRAQTGAITLQPAGRAKRVPVVSASGFAGEPLTDATRFENRHWVRQVLARARQSDAGASALAHAEQSARHPEITIDRACAVGEVWGQQRSSERGTRVARLALATASARDRLIEVIAAESGAPVAVIDAEVNGAIDAARYLGQLAGGLGAVRGARFHPDRLALVVAGAGAPLIERAEATLAALAAGSAVVLVAHPSVARSSAVLIEEWQAGGLPEGLVTLAMASGDGVDCESPHAHGAAEFAADTRVDRALVLGERSIAEAVLRRRPGLRVEGRFRSSGAVLIAPSADFAQAVRHAVVSAFGAGWYDSGTARALVLLGTAARSKRLRRHLVDAVQSLRVGDTSDPGARDPLSFALGPLPAPPGEPGLRALTELEPGEEWLVRPQRLDDAGRLWSPGVRVGVRRDSRFWADSVGMPVLGVITALTVDEAITLSNRLGGGAAAIHAFDPGELLPWLERVSAGSLAVNKATTGARIERQPWGGGPAAGSGGGPLAGGPNRLLTLGSWRLREGTASSTLHLRGLKPEVRLLIETSQPSLDYQSFDRVRRAALTDALAWRTTLGGVHDVSGLGIERNLLRRRPEATHVRLSEYAALADLVRVLSAAFTVGAPLSVSTGVVLPGALGEVLERQGVNVSLERDDDWLERMAVSGPGDAEQRVSRLRLIGGDRARTAEWLTGRGEVSLWADPVTMAGPVELLAFVTEQSISVNAHRHGLALAPAGITEWIAEQQDRV